MKYRTILVILALSTFTLFGCGKTETNIPETSIEEEITDTTTDADESNKEAYAEVLETDATESMLSSDTSPLDPSNITLNPDGTYSFTDEFLVAVQGINGAAGLTEENLNKMLQEVAPMLIGLAESGISTEADVIGIIESYVGIYEYNQAVEQQKPQQNQNQQKPSGGTSQNNGGDNNSQKPSGGSSKPTYSGGDNAAGPGAMDDMFNFEDGNVGEAEGSGKIDEWR